MKLLVHVYARLAGGTYVGEVDEYFVGQKVVEVPVREYRDRIIDNLNNRYVEEDKTLPADCIRFIGEMIDILNPTNLTRKEFMRGHELRVMQVLAD